MHRDDRAWSKAYAAAQQGGNIVPVENPIEHALSLVGLAREDLRRPFSHEEGYHLTGRNPLIDHIAQSPFRLHHWADTNSKRLQANAQNGINDSLVYLLEMINGGVSYDGGVAEADMAFSVIEAYAYLCRQYGVEPQQAVLENIRQAGFTDNFDQQLAALIVRLTRAAQLTQKAFAGLDSHELAFLKSRPERFFFPDGIQFNFLTAPTHTQTKIVSITRKIDFVSLFTAAVHMTSGIETFVAFIKSLQDIHDPQNYFSDGKQRDSAVLEIPTPVGGIVILGQGKNVCTGNAALVVDLGGHDYYLGRSGVGHLVPGRLSIGIDISGNDIYDCKKKRYAQGLGVLGIGMIIDLTGSDRYLAGDMAQGSGVYGVGLVADLSGDDVYRMGIMGQGFGVFGIGFLLDTGGNDKYMIRGMGQGAGSTLGIGSLCDLSGNDKYLADRNKKRGRLSPDTWSHVQGAGLSIRSPDWSRHLSLYGGIGFLNDGGGNDFYYASDGNCMGSSYFMSLGALVDHQGNDRYVPQNGSGLGYAVHLSNAIVIDRNGNDYYFARTHSGGVGSDRSTALLIDYAGDDVYGPSPAFVREKQKKAATHQDAQLTAEEADRQVQSNLADVSYGSALKPKALGFLIDVDGNDQYFVRRKGWGESLGGVIPPAQPQHWSHAFLIDLRGRDFYAKEGRRDNHYVTYFNHGLCYDTEYNGPLQITKTPLPAVARSAAQANAAFKKVRQTAFYADLMDLLNPDLFMRYKALGRVLRAQPDTSADLIKFLSASANSELNRDLLEALMIRVIDRQIHLERSQEFELLLSAKDHFVRRFAARAFGRFAVKSALPALVAALGEENDDVRSDILWALGQMDSPEGITSLVKAVQNDSALKCRKSAVMALAHILNRIGDKVPPGMRENSELFINLLADSDDIIRTHAAKALKNLAGQPDTIEALKQSLNDRSVYVRRAAAQSLVLNGIQAGIPVIIETLRYPSIDTFEHYDHELVKDLAYYTGVDFPEEKRYNYDTWKRWWLRNGAQVNLKQNLTIMARIERAFRAPNEESGITIFEQLITEYPRNAVVKNRYKRFCFEWITFRLLTRENINKDILKRCLRLQKIVTELEGDNPESLARLAYFLGRLRKFNEAVAAIQKAIQLDPADSGYRDALEHYRKLKQRAEINDET